MKIGLALPSMVEGFHREEMLEWMRVADEGPFSILGVGERIAYPNQEMMTLLAGAAAVTDRVGLFASVSVTPMHSPAYVAKQAATIDVLSGGRFTLGVGVGGRDEDYRALGASFTHRHQTLDDHVAVMKNVWAGGSAVAGVGPVGPAPVQVGGPRLLTGSMGPKSMARAAQWADGLAGFDMSADVAAIGSANMAFSAAWVEAGRVGVPWLQSSGWFALSGDDPAAHLRDYAYRYLQIFGDDIATMLAGMQRLHAPSSISDSLKALSDTGLDEFILCATSRDVDDATRAADLVTNLTL